jgi:crossover junction endodeoxyribonuclease RusA
MSATDVYFVVPGLPATQGSKRYVGNGRMIEADKRLPTYRADLRAAALAELGDQELFEGACRVSIDIDLVRPASHYGTGRNAQKLKPSAPAKPIAKPDVDKIARAVLDALTGVLWRDDAQVVSLCVRKLYDSENATRVFVGEA